MRSVLALLGLLLICSQAGPALAQSASPSMMPVGTLVGINAAGNTVAYTVPSGHMLQVVRVQIQASPASTGGYDGDSTKTAVARINGFAVATYESRQVRINNQGPAAALVAENTSGSLDLRVAGATVMTFQVDSGFSASWIGYLTHPETEEPECVCTPQPVTTPEPSPSPTPTPSLPPSSEPSPSPPPPSSEPSAPPGGPGLVSGFTHEQATAFLLVVDKIVLLGLAIVGLSKIIRIGFRFV